MLPPSPRTIRPFTPELPTLRHASPTPHINIQLSTQLDQLQAGRKITRPMLSIAHIHDAPPARLGPGHHLLYDNVIGKSTSSMALLVRIPKLKHKCAVPNDCLDSSAQIVEAIWPLSSVVCRAELGSKGVLPLRTFIQETLRRSRTSYSTLQVALYYLILIKAHVPQHDFTMEQPGDDHGVRALQCGRRMFLAALILASKYLQDRNYSARAWSKICGLSTSEINQNETAFLLAVNWKLHITEPIFQKWSDIMLRFTSNKPGGPGAIRSCSDAATWKAIVVQLTPELDNMDFILASPSVQARPCMPTSCFTSRPLAVLTAVQTTERPQNSILRPEFPLVRRSSLATSVSSISSPESMVSDTSSRSSPRSNGCSPVNRAGLKRCRPASIDYSVQGNVREILSGSYTKRVCCSTEFAAEFRHPSLLARPGMWAGILN